MIKIIVALCLFIPTLAFSTESQRINFNEYKKNIDKLNSECALKGMPSFSGFCLSQKYGDRVGYADQTQTSINVASQITSFDHFYNKCEHSDFSNVNDLINSALNIGETRKFAEEMKQQKEALETYSNYFDYCKTKEENNVSVTKKLQWFERMILKYSNITKVKDSKSNADTSAISEESKKESIPKEYIAKFQDYVPSRVGQINPNEYIWVNCSDQGNCLVKLGGNMVHNYNSVAIWKEVQLPNKALNYVREHKVVKPDSAMAWHANNLKPLLDSNSSINNCITLYSKTMNAPVGYLLLCRMDKNPWEKDALLFMGMMEKCSELFCGYEIYPMFRQEK